MDSGLDWVILKEKYWKENFHMFCGFPKIADGEKAENEIFQFRNRTEITLDLLDVRRTTHSEGNANIAQQERRK